MQITGTLTLAIVLARSVDWGQLALLMRGLHWGFIGLAALLLLGAHLTNAARWRYLARPAKMPYFTLLGYYGAGLFSNNFLPTGMGGDGVRAVLAARHMPAGRAAVSVALDRILGLAALVAFLLPGLWIGLPPNLSLPAIPLGWPFWAVLGVGGLLVAAGVGGLLWRYAPHARARALALYGRWFVLPTDTPVSPWHYWLTRLLGGLIFSCASVIFMILANIAFLVALNLPPWPEAALWAVVLSSLSLLAPIAVNGLGVMEGVYVLVLAGYGISNSAALSVALLARLFIVFYSLLGGLISLQRAKPSAHLHHKAPSGEPQP